VPAYLLGEFYILTTYSGDQASTDPAFLSFDVDRPVTVYVAICMTNMTGDTPNQSWLQSTWVLQDDQIRINHYDATHQNYAIFARDFAAGTVVLGVNEGVQNMYSVIVAPNDATGRARTPAVTESGATMGTAVTYERRTRRIHCTLQRRYRLTMHALDGRIVRRWSGAGPAAYEFPAGAPGSFPVKLSSSSRESRFALVW
jgi:hypothetical protein